ncbi:MAG: nodulation protein NfeD [Vicinamibacterales bacterium]
MRIVAVGVLAILLAWSTSEAPSAQTVPSAPRVVVAELETIIHPVSAEFVSDVIDRADAAEAELVVFLLRTPGGLLDSTRTIVSRMIASRTPVVMFVEPPGARAASAGFVLMMAADVAAMAPGTHIGAAHPVSGTGEAMDDTASEKAAADTAAYVRSLADARGRNVALAAEAVTESRAFTEREALEAEPPLVDLVADDVDALLRALDGRTIRRFDGTEVTLHLAGATRTPERMTWRQRFLSTIAHPQLASLLLTLGILGLTVELWNPGAIVPGVAGGLCLLLAFFAFQILPVSTTALLLVLFGLVLLALELTVPSFGVLGVGGIISLFFGYVMFSDTVPGVTVGLGTIVPLVLGVAAVFLFLGRLALASQRAPAATGAEGLRGARGRARAALTPEQEGLVDLHGEIWRAISRAPVDPGQPVRVTAVHGLTLTVEPAVESTGAHGREEGEP